MAQAQCKHTCIASYSGFPHVAECEKPGYKANHVYMHDSMTERLQCIHLKTGNGDEEGWRIHAHTHTHTHTHHTLAEFEWHITLHGDRYEIGSIVCPEHLLLSFRTCLCSAHKLHGFHGYEDKVHITTWSILL